MRTFAATAGRRDWDGLQSRWVLPAARRLYLIGALLALLVGALALVVALVFQLGTVGGASQEDVPARTAAVPRDIAVADLDSLFAGPQALRAEARPVDLPIAVGTTIATLDADSVYGIASYEMIGGPSADFVEQGMAGVDGGRLVDGMLLTATQALVARLEARASAGDAPGALPLLTVRIVAKDLNGNRSAPANVSFRVTEAQAVPDQPVATTGDVREDIGGPEALQATARALASIAAPKDTPEWFDAYKRAIRQPQQCGAAGDDTFSRQYEAAFKRVRSKLTASNLDTFYRGLCQAWDTAAAAAQAEARAANQRRDEVIARNAAAQATAAMRKVGARVARDAALGVALSAVFFFMIVALFLAFMAIEGHSHAIRQALQSIARREQGEPADA